MTRPGFVEWALNIANAVATRGDCTRRQVGAVILDRNNWPVAVGYNGSYPGGPSCLNGECPRGRHYVPEASGVDAIVRPVCACGGPWPCPEAVAPGSSYDTGPGACHSVHAELNAILHVLDATRLDSATMVVTERPCDGCLKILRSTAVAKVVWRDGTGTHFRHWPFER